jgi:hypothetical protein
LFSPHKRAPFSKSKFVLVCIVGEMHCLLSLLLLRSFAGRANFDRDAIILNLDEMPAIVQDFQKEKETSVAIIFHLRANLCLFFN